MRRLHECGACTLAPKYCGVECQRACWKAHKAECKANRRSDTNHDDGHAHCESVLMQPFQEPPHDSAVDTAKASQCRRDAHMTVMCGSEAASKVD